MSFERVMLKSDLWIGEKRGVAIKGKPVLLINIEDQIFAYEDRCAHQAVPLSKGRLEGKVLTCSAHEWQYDACTGRGVNPEKTQLKRYPVQITENMICVDIEGVANAR